MAVGDRHGLGQNQMQVRRKVFTGSWGENDVQLDKAFNAWRPSAQGRSVSNKAQVKTQEVFRLFRSILNKLSPEKFPQLMRRVEELEIDSEERLRGVIDLTFEKAIAEPGFSASYAKMCHHLMALNVRRPDGQEVNFRRLLLDLCQGEFERNKRDVKALKKNQEKQEEQEAASGEEKKKLLREELEEAEHKARRRSLGNIRFIGELFKLKMLTGAIMHDCIKMLLNSKDEESLECLCRLVSTMGKDLDVNQAKPRMDQYLGRMEQIVRERKTSSRIRFMLQDVIDLRLNKWVPRREQQGPKTIGQIHLEAEQEELRELEKVHMMQMEDDREPMEGQGVVEVRLNEPIHFTRFNIGTKTLHVDFGNQSFRPGWKGVNRAKGSNDFTNAKPAVPGGSLRQLSKAGEVGEHKAKEQNSDRRSVQQDKQQNNQDNKQHYNQQCGQSEGEGSSTQKSMEQSAEILVNKMQECQVSELSPAELSQRLDALIKDNSDNQTISDWIQRNLDEQQISSNAFVTALVTCISKSIIISGKFHKVDYAKISQRAALLRQYLQGKAHKQLQALCALQVLMAQMGHPPQLLRMIFDCLCDMGVVKEEVFFVWESSRDAAGQEGKDLAVKSVSGFFKWLKSCH